MGGRVRRSCRRRRGRAPGKNFAFREVERGRARLLTGRRRVRGYQRAQVGPAPPKLNKTPFQKLERPDREKRERALDERAEKVAESKETELLTPSMEGKDLDDMGFARLYERT